MSSAMRLARTVSELPRRQSVCKVSKVSRPSRRRPSSGTKFSRRIDAVVQRIGDEQEEGSDCYIDDVQMERVMGSIRTFRDTGCMVLHPKMRLGDADELRRLVRENRSHQDRISFHAVAGAEPRAAVKR